jgi:hypothetical protein
MIHDETSASSRMESKKRERISAYKHTRYGVKKTPDRGAQVSTTPKSDSETKPGRLGADSALAEIRAPGNCPA